MGIASRRAGGPGPGQKLVEAIVRPEIDETGKNVGDVGLAVDAIQFASLDQRGEHGPVLRTVVVAGEERILARERLRPHGAFDDVGVQINAAVVEEADKPVPVVEAVVNGIGDGRFGRDALELLVEERLECEAVRRGLRLAKGSPLVGAFTPDRRLDPVERGDTQERLRGDGGVAFSGDVEELAPQMRPAEGKRNPLFWQLLVRRVAVALHDAAIGGEQRVQMHPAPPRRMGKSVLRIESNGFPCAFSALSKNGCSARTTRKPTTRGPRRKAG